MTKRKTTKKQSMPRANKQQVARIDQLGSQLYQHRWPEIRQGMMSSGVLTPNRAKAIIYDLQTALGGIV